MATRIKRHKPKRMMARASSKLGGLYSRSSKGIRKHPYQAAGGALLSLGLASASFLLLRFLRK